MALPPRSIVDELRSALQSKNEEQWLSAVARANKAGLSGDKIAEVMEETVREDPVGIARFIESTHRPKQAFKVVQLDEGVEEWENGVLYHEAMFKGAFSAAWSVYPRIPHEDPWADDVDKADCEVVSSSGVVMTASGLATRG
eukprot:TRINITY_DN7593_c0_g1_i10.p1 TRINITY_DN7593_c0_g1~~TRINITY_DN7593_c0_g1_i10.p1  ORF type:complete len:142 (+),score=28.60 TRINITY_DN7593_c0_g1_i10:148-573(+)